MGSCINNRISYKALGWHEPPILCKHHFLHQHPTAVVTVAGCLALAPDRAAALSYLFCLVLFLCAVAVLGHLVFKVSLNTYIFL